MKDTVSPVLDHLTSGLRADGGADPSFLVQHVEICSLCQERLQAVAHSDPLLRHLREERVAQAPLPALAFHLLLARLDDRHLREARFEVGQQLQEYRLLERLGAGGMGVVFRALHVRLEKTVALKVLNRIHGDSPRGKARFEREMKAIGQLNHPNIVQAFDAGESHGALFLVMEHVGGFDLSRLVRERGPLLPADACELVRQAALGLQHAHDAGLIHRDVKPSNLMLTPDGQVKLLDLGLALLHEESPETEIAPPEAVTRSDGDSLTSASLVIGTRDYMAPEQGRNSHAVDARADVYSLGRTLCYLLTGASPPPLDIPAGLPRALTALLQQMLAPHPAHRPATMRALAARLKPLARGADVPALLGQPARRRRARLPLALAGAALLVVGLAALIVALLPRDQETTTVTGRTQASAFSPPLPPPPQPEAPPEPGTIPMTTAAAVELQAHWARHLRIDPKIKNSLGMEMALIPPGSLELNQGLTGRLTKPYRMSTTETTVGQFRAFIQATGRKTRAEVRGGLIYANDNATPRRDPKANWSNNGINGKMIDTLPVVHVDHDDATEFCRWLGERDGRNYRLPTEAEWRWACMAGDDRIYPDTLTKREMDRRAWYMENFRWPLPEVAKLEANPWGLYDVRGNVWEWCADWGGEYPKGTLTDPRGPAGGSNRVLCGGSYRDPPQAIFHPRAQMPPTTAASHLGFRVICDP